MKKEAIIEVRSVTKSFKDVRAVDQLDLDVYRGEYTALLGPNGAGKTTLVEMMEGIQKPDTGEILLFGKSWSQSEKELRRRVGLALQETRFIDKLSVIETLRLFGSFQGIGEDRIREIMNRMNLDEKSASHVVNLSGGQRQRLALGIALLSRPEILLLDEPTTGLDPHARREIWNVLTELRESGTTLILTTHYMEEAEHLCDRVVIMDHGRVIAQGSLDELLASGGGEIIEFKAKKSVVEEKLRSMKGVLRCEMREDGGKLIVKNMMKALPVFLATMKRSGTVLLDLECRKMTLDDIFISMTGRRLTE